MRTRVCLLTLALLALVAVPWSEAQTSKTTSVTIEVDTNGDATIVIEESRTLDDESSREAFSSLMEAHQVDESVLLEPAVEGLRSTVEIAEKEVGRDLEVTDVDVTMQLEDNIGMIILSYRIASLASTSDTHFVEDWTFGDVYGGLGLPTRLEEGDTVKVVFPQRVQVSSDAPGWDQQKLDDGRTAVSWHGPIEDFHPSIQAQRTRLHVVCLYVVCGGMVTVSAAVVLVMVIVIVGKRVGSK